MQGGGLLSTLLLLLLLRPCLAKGVLASLGVLTGTLGIGAGGAAPLPGVPCTAPALSLPC